MDLEKIAEEIKRRKEEKGQIAEQAGVDIPHDNFLHGLQESLLTGQPNKASAKLKVVNERSKNMIVQNNEVINKNINPINEDVLREVNNIQPNYSPNPNNPNIPQGVAKDDQYFKNLNESQQLMGNSNNAGVADAITMFQGNKPQGKPMITNPNYLTEQVNNAVQTYMQTNVGIIVEAAVKSAMMEMYQKEKVEAALNENKEMIQKIVVETILALKKRNTQKK